MKGRNDLLAIKLNYKRTLTPQKRTKDYHVAFFDTCRKPDLETLSFNTVKRKHSLKQLNFLDPNYVENQKIGQRRKF